MVHGNVAIGILDGRVWSNKELFHSIDTLIVRNLISVTLTENSYEFQTNEPFLLYLITNSTLGTCEHPYDYESRK